MSKHTESKHGNIRHETAYPSQRNENIKVTAEKAKLAKTRAQQIFLSMIETSVSSKYFIKQARYINPAYYEDIVSERAIGGLCGYPLCSKTFVDLYGERKYIIRNNKVYDITSRRNFCSNVCYEASDILCKQLATDPLYLRDSDAADLKDVRIPVLERLQGRFGKLVDVTGGLIKLEEDRPKEKVQFTSVGEIAQETLITCSENRMNNVERKLEDFKDTVKKNTEDEAKRTSETVETQCEDHEEERKLGSDVTKQSLNKQGDTAKESEDPRVSIFIVEQALREWMSFDSLRVVLGDKYVRGMLEHIGQTWDDYDTTSGLRLDVEAKAKYIAICRKLDYEERQDNVDLLNVQTEDIKVQPQLPLPNYKQLQEDAKRQELKVVSFLGGSDQYEEPSFCQKDEEGSALETIVEEGSGPQCLGEGGSSEKAQRELGKRKSKKLNVEIDEEESTLPFIDNYSQVAWRQYIVQEKVKSYLQQIVEVTDLDGREVHRLVKKLVATFDLSPHNISFKPRQWQLIAVILLKMLTVRYPVIEEALKGEQAHNLQKTVLSGFHLDFGYCDRVLCYLTEIKYIISKNFETEQKVHSQQNKRCNGKIDKTQEEMNLDENFHKVLKM